LVVLRANANTNADTDEHINGDSFLYCPHANRHRHDRAFSQHDTDGYPNRRDPFHHNPYDYPDNRALSHRHADGYPNRHADFLSIAKPIAYLSARRSAVDRDALPRRG